jgi:hypothetical protein
LWRVRQALAIGPGKTSRVLPQTRISDTLRAHAGSGIAALALALAAGGAFAAWRASRRAEPDVNARTWARLVPRAPAATPKPEA